jgi:CheY-like chemotaxis protein
MPDARAKLLIVDDDHAIRFSMAHVLAEARFRVRTAADGFSALAELRQEMPEIMICDLNMPDMSGFELLSVVRRRFPSVQVIAMSGAFSGGEIPSGVAADAFYQKGSSVTALMKIIDALPWPERMSANPQHRPAIIWIPRNGYDSSGEPFVTIACPECLRTFTHALQGAICQIRETACAHCRSVIHFAIFESADRDPLGSYQRKQSLTSALHLMQRVTT